MDSPNGYPESPTDGDDVVYPCKGCGEILEEGKAFELAGNRWHIDCFRCNTCGTLLDSDANLLLLGDGSLICNNCTYSCNHCGNKIEDLAILTGDQAFCANCFRCRNCKRKIENLRYARTSQGIFCMTCHESLMARRRKKNKKPPAAGPAPKVDKSLPALPPNAAQAAPSFTPDLDTPSDVFSEPPTADASPRPPHSQRNDSSPANFRRDASPASMDDGRGMNLTLPASTFKESHLSEVSDAGDDNGILLPFALDPNTAPGPSPHGKSASRVADGDYFHRQGTGHREMLKENRSRSASAERQPKSPHIAYQEKSRQQSEQPADTMRKRKEAVVDTPVPPAERTRSQHASPAASQASEAFKLQEVPKNKRAEARKESSARSPSYGGPTADPAASPAVTAPESSTTSPQPTRQKVSRDTSPVAAGSSYTSNPRLERPARGDSLANAGLKSTGSMSKTEKSAKSPATPTASQPERKPSSATVRPQQNGTHHGASPRGSGTAKTSTDPPPPPQRSAGRPAPPSGDTFTSPRATPQMASQSQSHKATESVSTVQSDSNNGAPVPSGLLRYSAQADFSQDEDFARLLSGQEGLEKEGSVLRRVSNAMSKHGRSFSDRGSISRGHKKWPTNGSIDISSPTIPSPESREENVNLRNELRRAQQRIAELEAEKNGLQETVHSAADIKQANTMLREKRNTIAVLDTQREMIIRELEIMTDHLKQAKANGGAVDINLLKSEITKDFATSLEKLKDQLSGQIEDLITRRTALTEEISNLIQMKDKGFQEYESLSAQNKKLADMNQNLIENIQGTLKSNKQQQGNQGIDIARSPANGLGIYHTHHRGGKSDISIDGQTIMHEPSFSNLHETESEATLAQPQVVNIRKGGKPTKFSNWKKGGQAITKNVTKGFKGAFGPSEKREDEYNVKVIGTPYGSTHHQPDFASMSSSVRSREESQQPTPRGWFGGKTATGRPPNDRVRPIHGNNSSNNLEGGEGTALFGSDLSARCDFEKRMIPAIVSRCIEEVESRGMEAEGVYRKSGGNSQVTQVKQGFEADNEFDISDPDLDIHAVTSALKNYFHRLPVPLIPFSIYEQFLEAGGSENQKARSMHVTLQQMPRAHYDTLQFLVFHLSRVYQHAEENLMTPLNLAVVFAPTILRPLDPNREFSDMTAQRVAVQALLENHKNIFFEEE